MAYYKVDKKKFARMRGEAQRFQDDIVCAVGTDFMRNIAEAENKMIFDILKGVENDATVEVVEVVRCPDCINCKNMKCTELKDNTGHPLDVAIFDYCSQGVRKERSDT